MKFDCGIENINFCDRESSAMKINGFVEQKTNNKIKDLIDPNQLNGNTRLVAVNALYFKADWVLEFDKRSTYQDDFYISSIKNTKVDYMRQYNHFKFAHLKDLGAKILELKYKIANDGTDYSFVIVLPNKRVDLSALATDLQNYDFKQIITKMRRQPVDVKIPKFKIEFDLSLNNMLKEVL